MTGSEKSVGGRLDKSGELGGKGKRDVRDDFPVSGGAPGGWQCLL